MIKTITAIYEHGLLRPIDPLTLPEQSTVELEIRLIYDPAITKRREQVRAALDRSGVLVVPHISSDVPSPLTPEARAQLAQRLARAGVPALSAAILEEREG
jgi:predicted DNA-binding antitoxin AbrB/MazE fold protein